MILLKKSNILLYLVVITASLTLASISAAHDKPLNIRDNMVFIKGGCFQMGNVKLFEAVPGIPCCRSLRQLHASAAIPGPEGHGWASGWRIQLNDQRSIPLLARNLYCLLG